MSALPMANDHDVMTATKVMAETAVAHEGLSPEMIQQLEAVKRTRVSKTFQVRLIAPLTTATVQRLRTEGMGIPALAGFMNVGAYLNVDLFAEALQDLQERYEHIEASTPAHRAARAAPLAVALDFAAAREPKLSYAHVKALGVHLSARTHAVT
jgi:hypothetical protein